MRNTWGTMKVNGEGDGVLRMRIPIDSATVGRDSHAKTHDDQRPQIP